MSRSDSLVVAHRVLDRLIVGGDWGDPSPAKDVRLQDPSGEVVLLEPNRTFVSCPFSNQAGAAEPGQRQSESVEGVIHGISDETLAGLATHSAGLR